MKVKLAFVLGVGVGYVVGTRAGRARYEQMTGWLAEVWHDPRVQEQVGQARARAAELAGEQAAALKQKVTEAATSFGATSRR